VHGQRRFDVAATVGVAQERVEDLAGDERHGSFKRGRRIKAWGQHGKADAETPGFRRPARGNTEDEHREQEPENGTRHAQVIRRNHRSRDGASESVKEQGNGTPVLGKMLLRVSASEAGAGANREK
jgi:hypothetical protein